MYEKLKAFFSDDAIFFALLVVLVGVASFGLGRVSTQPFSPAGDGQATVRLAESPDDSETIYIGSRNGSKYHYPWCPGATQMKEENRLVFPTREAAEAAGYTPASNCPGLVEGE